MLNSKSNDFIFPNNNNDTKANMWNLKTYTKYLRKKNIDCSILKEKIKDIIIKSVISVYKSLISKLILYNLNDINFYNILGYDIIITDKFEPILLEINTGPSMTNYTNLDKSMKTNLFVDTLNLVGITPFYKNIILNNKTGINFNINIQEEVDKAICELTRPRGDYELIFPIKSNINKYEKYFKDNIRENEIFWRKIRELDLN